MMRNRLIPTSIYIPVFLCYFALLALPLVAFFFLRGWLFGLFGHNWWILPLSVEMATALIAPFLYVSFQRRVQERILERQRQYQETFLEAAQGMTLIKELKRLLNLIVHILTRTVGVEQASLWLLEKKTGRFLLQVARGEISVNGNEAIAGDRPLVQYLIRQRDLIVQREIREITANGRASYLAPVAVEMARIGAAIIIPSFIGEKLLGFVALGPKKSKQPYTAQDLEIFDVMAGQAALAIENAQFYEELRQTQADLIQTSKMASLGLMAVGMSHQINNRFYVMAILAGTLKATLQRLDLKQMTPELLLLTPFVEQTKEVLTKIEDNALRGGDIVKTLLRFSRPAREYKPISVSKILETALDVARFRVNFNQLDLVQKIPEDLPMIQGNLNQLADSLFNLTSNAFDATQKKLELIHANQLPHGPKDPSPYRGQIQVMAKVDEVDGKSWVVLEFQDNGIGMTPQELESLFIPFFTTKATTQKGTGLGLYVIQRIIERHGGTITATSTYGVGTTFTITLPASELKAEVAQ